MPLARTWSIYGDAMHRRGYAVESLIPGAPTNPTPTTPTTPDRPTGANYVAFEDLYTSSMGTSSLALNAVAQKVTGGKILTLPAGVFTIGTGGWDGTNDGTFSPALWLPKTCGGIWGMGRGSLGTTDGTVIRLAPNTASNPSVAGAAVYGGGGGSSPLTFKNLHFEGTDQGVQAGPAKKNGEDGVSPKLFTLVYTSNAPKVLVEDVLVNGWYGNNGSPPGETFGIQIYGTNGDSTGTGNCVMRRVEVDGRRTVGGPSFGGAGWTFGTCNGWYAEDVYSHHSNVCAAGVLYQTTGGKSVRLKVGSSSDNDGTSQFGKKGGGLNHERTTGSVHVNPDLWVPSDGKKIHVWHSNDAYQLNGVSVSDGSLVLTDPTFNNAWGDNRLYIETWGPVYGPDANWGSTETNVTAPTVTRGGVDLPYKWARQGKQTLVTSGQYVS